LIFTNEAGIGAPIKTFLVHYAFGKCLILMFCLVFVLWLEQDMMTVIPYYLGKRQLGNYYFIEESAEDSRDSIWISPELKTVKTIHLTRKVFITSLF
jgi:hypothetical protein